MNAQRYTDLFRAEARERLTEMNNALLAIERGGDSAVADRISELFRAVHNMKGMSAAMGYQSIRDLSHALETLLDGLRHVDACPSPAVIDGLFEAVDVLESAVVGVLADPEANHDVSDAVQTLEELAAANGPDVPAALMPTMEWPAMPGTNEASSHSRRFTPPQSVRVTVNDEARFTPPLDTRPAPSAFSIIEGRRSVRVDAERLDTLMTLIGELVIARGRLAELVRCISNEPLESLERLTHGHHPAFRDLFLKAPDESRGLRHDLRQLWLTGLPRQLRKPAARNHQLTNQRHQRVEPLGVHSDAPPSFDDR
ncbi:MAG TPA: Hpt domain-containing protein, partial [Polyangiaceae bacterium]